MAERRRPAAETLAAPTAAARTEGLMCSRLAARRYHTTLTWRSGAMGEGPTRMTHPSAPPEEHATPSDTHEACVRVPIQHLPRDKKQAQKPTLAGAMLELTTCQTNRACATANPSEWQCAYAPMAKESTLARPTCATLSAIARRRSPLLWTGPATMVRDPNEIDRRFGCPSSDAPARWETWAASIAGSGLVAHLNLQRWGPRAWCDLLTALATQSAARPARLSRPSAGPPAAPRQPRCRRGRPASRCARRRSAWCPRRRRWRTPACSESGRTPP